METVAMTTATRNTPAKAGSTSHLAALDGVTINRSTVTKRSAFGEPKVVAEALAADMADALAGVGSVMFKKALFTHWAVEFAQIGKGCTWENGEDYAGALGNRSKSYATLLRRLATAAVDLKVDDGTDVWRFLASRGGDARVGHVLNATDTKPADKVAALQALHDEWRAGTYRAVVRKVDPNADNAALGAGSDGAETGASDHDAQAEAGAPTSIIAESVNHAVATIDAAIGTFTRDEALDLEEHLRALGEKVVARLQHLASEVLAAEAEAASDDTVKGEVVDTPAPKPTPPRKSRRSGGAR